MHSVSKGYSPITEIARGGMGAVHIVARRHGTYCRLYAMKRLLEAHRGDVEVRAMFLEEARIAGLLRHPNAVSVLDVGEDEDGPYLVMELVEGVSLATLIRSSRSFGPLPLQLCLRIALQIADGLHGAHELRSPTGQGLGLVHRDVSPPNILIGYDGLVRVTDFGIAKALGGGTRTSTGVLKGKLCYMSPEQLRFEELDRRADLFALGAVIFEMLSDRPLYEGRGAELARQILHEPTPDIHDGRGDLPASLVELLFELLAKSPSDRPADAAKVSARLSVVLEELLHDEETISIAAFVSQRFEAEREEMRKVVSRALERADQTLKAFDVAAVAVNPKTLEPPRKFRRAVVLAVAVAATIVTSVVAALVVEDGPAAPHTGLTATIGSPPAGSTIPEPQLTRPASRRLAPVEEQLQIESPPVARPSRPRRTNSRRRTRSNVEPSAAETVTEDSAESSSAQPRQVAPWRDFL